MENILKKIPELVADGLDGIVFYVDGGMRTVLGKGRASFGMHAYFYKDEVAKKGHGAKEFIPTPQTYVAKAKCSAEEKCTVLCYYDAFGPSSGGTNQTGEMDGLLQALRIILESKVYESIKRIRIYSDSRYVIDGTTQWLQGWKKRNWITGSGNPVTSKERWLEIDELWTKVNEVCDDITLTWVKGHEDYGNIQADYQASSGLFHNDKSRELISDTTNYYNTDTSNSKLLLDSKLYHLYEIATEVDGQSQYLTFSHPSQGFDVKDDVGKRVRDFGVGVIRLKESEPVVDEALRICRVFNERVADVPIIANLQNMLKFSVSKEIESGMVENFNVTAEGVVKSLTGENLLTIVNPSRLAYKLKPEYSHLNDVLDDYLNRESHIGITEITDLFYDKSEKKGKVSLKFKLTTESSIRIPALFKVDDKEVTSNVTITFGNDTPQRRTFSAVADLNPKISVVTYAGSDAFHHYAFVLETDEGVGIWCGPFDNTQKVRR